MLEIYQLGGENEDEINTRMAEWMTNEHPFFQLAEIAKWNPNPFEGLCGTCRYFDKKNYCNLHKRIMKHAQLSDVHNGWF